MKELLLLGATPWLLGLGVFLIVAFAAYAHRAAKQDRHTEALRHSEIPPHIAIDDFAEWRVGDKLTIRDNGQELYAADVLFGASWHGNFKYAGAYNCGVWVELPNGIPIQISAALFAEYAYNAEAYHRRQGAQLAAKRQAALEQISRDPYNRKIYGTSS